MSGTSDKSALQSRLYSLDALRGVAALAVVLTHWSDFFYDGATRLPFDPERQAFNLLLGPIYTYGWRAVDFFFCLSGFVFYCLYADRIAQRRVSLAKFSLLRFSRLYPLHFATLIVVAAGQWAMQARQGSFFVIPTNDLNHFIQHLFFASSWGFGHISFNGPVWSVSVEVVLYAVFFAACSVGLRAWWQVGSLAALGFVLEFNNRFTAIGRGMVGFFIGTLCAIVFLAVRKRGIRIHPVILCLLIVGGWAFAILDLRNEWGYRALKVIVGEGMRIGPHPLHHALTHFAFDLVPFQLAAIPLTVLSLALLEDRCAGLWHRTAFLGDISYSSYLLHFPLQFAIVAAGQYFGWSYDVYYTPGFFIGFVVVLILLSSASYRYFEHPAQAFIRSRFLPAKPAADGPGGRMAAPKALAAE